jgi:hypothetical protein
MFQEVGYGMLSPTVARFNDTFHVWYVYAAPLGSKSQSSEVRLRTSDTGKLQRAPFHEGRRIGVFGVPRSLRRWGPGQTFSV